MSAERKTFARRLAGLAGRGNAGQRLTRLKSIVSARQGLTTNCPPPWWLQVEVTNRCNINCVFCSRAVSEMDLGDLSPTLADQVVALSAGAQETALFGYGEPLISKAFYQLLPRLRSAVISFFTNGLVLDGDLYRKICDQAARPLGFIVFSIDAAEPALYETIRVGSNFKRVWRNLETTARLSREPGRNGPEINIEFVAMASNVGQLPQLVRMADQAGVNAVKVSHLVVWDEKLRDQSLVYHPELLRSAFEAASEAAEGLSVKLDLPKVFDLKADSGEDRPAPPCRYPWYYAMISFEGIVRACCFAPEFAFGDLRNEPFDKIWTNDRYRALRRRVNSEQCPTACLRCEERFRYDPSPDEERTYIKLQPRLK